MREIDELDNKEWKKKEPVEKRRMLDAEITKEYLKKNNDVIKEIAENFSQSILNAKADEKNKIEKFYLKGGKSISILKGDTNAIGDYDFQLVPNQEVYDNWSNLFPVIDNLILQTLGEVAVNSNLNVPNADMDIWKAACTRIPGMEETINVSKENEGLLRIGIDYKDKSYRDIISDAHYDKQSGRINLDENKINKDGSIDIKGLHIYVNYTIPGFILYRLVKSYKCEIVDNNEKLITSINLKSEIIDVSVPRPGSPECHISQAGVITNFRKKGGFNIPGWGYHFYENINLLQEVISGNSGSPHKAKKRWDRLNESINELLKVNTDVANGENINMNLVKDKIYEPYENDKNEIMRYEIMGYIGVWLYPLTLLMNNSDDIYKNMCDECREHVLRVIKQNVNEPTSAFVSCMMSTTGDAKLPNLNDIKEEVNNIKNCINDVKEKSVKSVFPSIKVKVNSKTPEVFNGKYIFIKVDVDGDIWGCEKIKDSLNNKYRNDVIESKGVIQVKIRNGGGMIVYAIIYSNDKTIKAVNFLEKTVLFSQRLAYIKSYAVN